MVFAITQRANMTHRPPEKICAAFVLVNFVTTQLADESIALRNGSSSDAGLVGATMPDRSAAMLSVVALP